MTLREIADREGLTFARIQQIEKQALKKLAKRSKDLEDFLIDWGLFTVALLILGFKVL